MTGRPLLVALALTATLAACRLDGSLEAYCERTGECACADGDCCTVEGGRCSDAWGCCPGLTCEGRQCVVRDPPSLSFTPDAVDFGDTTPVGGTSATVDLVLNNAGSGATPQPVELTLVPTTGGVLVEGRDCEGRVLPVGGACTVTVAARPMAWGSFDTYLVARAGSFEATAKLSYTAGGFLTVAIDGGGVTTISSHPPGILCPPDCTAGFNDGEQIWLTASTPAGSQFLRFEGIPCAAGSSCSFRFDGGVRVEAVVDPWLKLRVEQDGWFEEGRLEVAGTRCTGTCGLPVAGTQTLEVFAGPRDGLDAWTGACADAGLMRRCTVDVLGPTTVGVQLSPANRVFLSPPVAATLLGPDLARADAVCGEGYRAWLFAPDAGIGPAERFGAARGWTGTSGPFADTLEGLVQGHVFYPVDPYAQVDLVATGGLGLAPSADCDGWNSLDGAFTGGAPGAGGIAWAQADGAVGDCSQNVRVYCFGITKRQGVFPDSYRLKVAFLSSPWRPGGGLASADAHCTAEAQAHGLAGQFRAALQTPTSAPAVRLNTWAHHRRLDRVDLIYGPPLNVLADAGYHPASGSVEGGTYAWTGDAAAHCAYWTSSAGNGRVGRPELPRESGGMSDRLLPCATAQRLYCQQE